MSISTQTAALLDFYNQKISLDQKQLEHVNSVQSGYTVTTGVGSSDSIKVWGPEEIIENYNYPIEKLDSKILELNNQIVSLKNTILTIGQNADAAGCGTTGVSYVTVTAPTVRCKVYAFSGSNPFTESTENLSSSNLGVGVENQVVNSGIGSYKGDIGTCYLVGCGSAFGGSCASAASSITFYQALIPPLEEERDELITKVNTLKNGRINHELQNYAYNRSKTQINNSIQSSDGIISFLQDPANEKWL